MNTLQVCYTLRSLEGNRSEVETYIPPIEGFEGETACHIGLVNAGQRFDVTMLRNAARGAMRDMDWNRKQHERMM